MSIERYYRQYTPICDCCGARLPGEGSWADALRAMRGAGWESRKSKGKWKNICTDCQFEEKGYGHDHIEGGGINGHCL